MSAAAATSAAMHNRARELRRPQTLRPFRSQPIPRDLRAHRAILDGLRTLKEVRRLTVPARWVLHELVCQILESERGALTIGHFQMPYLKAFLYEDGTPSMSKRALDGYIKQIRQQRLLRTFQLKHPRTGKPWKLRYALGHQFMELMRQELADRGRAGDLFSDADSASPSPLCENKENYVVREDGNARASAAPAKPDRPQRRTRAQNGNEAGDASELEHDDPQRLLLEAERLAHVVGIVLKPLDRTTLIRVANSSPPDFWKYTLKGVHYALSRGIENIGGTAAVFTTTQLQFANIRIPSTLERFKRTQAELADLRKRGFDHADRPQRKRPPGDPRRISVDVADDGDEAFEPQRKSARGRDDHHSADTRDRTGRGGPGGGLVRDRRSDDLHDRTDRDVSPLRPAAADVDRLSPAGHTTGGDERAGSGITFLLGDEFEFYKRHKKLPEEAPALWKRFLEERSK